MEVSPPPKTKTAAVLLFTPNLINYSSKTNKTFRALLEKRRTHKRRSPMDSYTWTHQYWSTSINLPLSTLCWDWKPSRELSMSDGRYERIYERESKKSVQSVTWLWYHHLCLSVEIKCSHFEIEICIPIRRKLEGEKFVLFIYLFILAIPVTEIEIFSTPLFQHHLPQSPPCPNTAIIISLWSSFG